jgi:hypothetical protein
MRQTQGLADSIIVDAKDPMQATIRLFQSMLGFLNGELDRLPDVSAQSDNGL